ncbi:MAG TPA: pitrilysin family protein [Solirubrobacteraceae bacterium]
MTATAAAIAADVAAIAARAARVTVAATAIPIAADPGHLVTSGHRLTTLESGVRVVTEAMPSVRSAALGFFVGTGSSMEDEPAAGWSHLLEHMLFRGTNSYASLEIDQIFDGMGAELNAGTGKESTSVYSRVLDVHLERAFDVMSDMVWRPLIASDELEAEGRIVVEEIAMYEDDPTDRVFDILGEAVFPDHPLGRPVIGTRESVGAADAEALRAFHTERYAPGDLVVAAAGSVDHSTLVRLVKAAQGFDRAGRRAPSPPPPPEKGADRAARVRFIAKDTEQYHLALGAPGIARDDERRYAMRVLDTVLGGTSSSRLFQEVRERRGLAYSIFSFHQSFAGTGQIGIYLGTRPDNVAVGLQVVADELERLRQDGIASDELVRAKEHAQGRLVLGLESTSARMSRLGGAVLAGLPVLSVDELIDRIDAVTGEEVVDLVRDLYAPERISAAGIGPQEDAFRTALEPIAPALAEVA